MRLEISKNAKRNIAFGILNKLITTFYPFLIRTFIIHKIGAEYLGLNSLFSAILQVLNLTELGFSSAVVFSMYKPIAEDDEITLCAILKFYKKVYFLVGLIITILGVAILPLVPYLIKGDAPEGISIRLLYLIYLANTTISYFLFAYKTSLLNAYQRIDIISTINTVVYIVVYTLQLLVVIYTKNFYLFAATYLLSTISINISTALCTKKLFPKLHCEGKLDNKIKIQIKTKIKGLMISKVTGMSRNSLDSIFISLYVGLVETAIYNNYFYILSAVSGFVIIFNSSIAAGIGNSLEIESEQKNYLDFKKLNFLYMWISGWTAICMLCLYQPFTEIFFGKNMLFPINTVIMFCAYYYQLRTGDILSSYADARGLWWELRFASITEAILNILLNFLLGKYFGSIGIVSATTISLFITSFFIGSRLSIKYVFPNFKYREYIKQHLLYITVTMIIASITFTICSHINVHNKLLYLILCGLICIIVPNLLYISIYFRFQIFQDSVKWFIEKIKGVEDK